MYRKNSIAVAYIVFPLLFILANLLHRNLFEIGLMSTTEAWVNNFTNNPNVHLAHLLELMASPLLIVIAIDLINRINKNGKFLSNVGVTMAIIGSTILAASKGALCLTASAFDTLGKESLNAGYPLLEVLFTQKGFMSVLHLLILLPLGFVIIGIAMYRSNVYRKSTSLLVIVGSLFLVNPGIELLNLIGSCILACAMIPMGIRLFRNSKDVSKALPM